MVYSRLNGGQGGGMRIPSTISLCDKQRQTRSVLSDGDASALVVACTGKGSDDAEILKKARRVLKQARDTGLWFVCDCHDGALLHPRLINGGFSLVRNAHSTHAPDCIFVPRDNSAAPTVAVEATVENKAASSSEGYRARTVYEGHWLTGRTLESVVVARTESVKDKERSGGGGKDLDGLSKRLFAGLLAMGLCEISSNDLVQSNGKWLVSGKDWKALKRLDSMGMGYGLTWADVGCCWLKDLAGLRKRLAGMKELVGSRALEGFFLGPLSSVRLHAKGDGVLEHTVRGFAYTASVHGRIALPGFNRGGEGAYLGIGRLRETKGLSYIPIIGASVVPVFSTHLWMPVESELERKTLAKLLSVLRWYRQRSDGKGPEIKIHKPMFDLCGDGSDDWCRPDFILDLPNGRRVVIETMGMRDSQDYAERKQRMHPRMKALPGVCDLLEDGGEEDNILKEALCKLIADNS